MAQTAYETVFILPTGQADDAVRGTIDKYRGVIENAGGTIDDVDTWEPRRLAYPIKKQREGIYVVVNFLANAEAKNELDRIFRISDDVLRHMIVKQDEKADRYPSKIRAAEAEKRERDMAARAAAQQQASANEAPTVTDLPSEENGAEDNTAESDSASEE